MPRNLEEVSGKITLCNPQTAQVRLEFSSTPLMPKANFVKPTSRGVLKKAVDVCPKIKKLKDNRTEQRRLENLLKLLQQEEVKLQQDPAITGCFPDHPAVNALSDGKGSRKGPSIQWSTSLDGKSSSKKSNTGSGKAAKVKPKA